MEHTSSKSSKIRNKVLILTATLVAVCGIGFYGGVQFQKNKKPVTSSSVDDRSGFSGSGQMGPGNGAYRRGGNRSFGSVTAVSGESITIKDSRQNTDVTYKITSSTAVLNNGTSGTLSDIKVGNQVMITPDSSDSTTAGRILLGGPGIMQPNSPNSSQTN